MEPDISQHNTEIHENAQSWQRKPMLREVYAEFYSAIAARVAADQDGLIVECGSGMGNLKTVLPDCICTDLFPNPWIDQTENVFALSFADDSVASLILFDVFHHLEYPGTALAEIRRVLVPGGRLIMFEPAMGLLGRISLGLFHHEPLGLRREIEWNAPAAWAPDEARYHAAQGNAWRIFRKGEFREQLAGWRILETQAYPALRWLLAGGFRGPQLCPSALSGLVGYADRVLSIAPSLFATRLLVVLEKNSGT